MREFYTCKQTETEPNAPDILKYDEIDVGEQDIRIALRKLKNRKRLGQDDIINKLLKYGGGKVNQQLTTLNKKILFQHKVPDKWRTSLTIPLFKEEDTKLSRNKPSMHHLEVNDKNNSKHDK